MNLKDFSQTLRDLLQLGWVEVTFTKKDGSKRLMKCTTVMDLIPEDKRPITNGQPEKEVEETDYLFKVYEQDNGWRSFRSSQVIGATYTL